MSQAVSCSCLLLVVFGLRRFEEEDEEEDDARTQMSIWTLLAFPIALMLPRVRAALFGALLRVPSRTYLMPRGIVRLIIGMRLGTVAGLGLLRLLRDPRMFG